MRAVHASQRKTRVTSKKGISGDHSTASVHGRQSKDDQMAGISNVDHVSSERCGDETETELLYRLKGNLCRQSQSTFSFARRGAMLMSILTPGRALPADDMT